MLENAPTRAIVAVDTEENEPLKMWVDLFSYSVRSLGESPEGDQGPRQGGHRCCRELSEVWFITALSDSLPNLLRSSMTDLMCTGKYLPLRTIFKFTVYECYRGGRGNGTAQGGALGVPHFPD